MYYPAPDQTGVPLHFPIGGEEPNPIPESRTGKAGYPITVFFPEDQPLQSASAILTDGTSREVAVWFSAPRCRPIRSSPSNRATPFVSSPRSRCGPA